MFKVLYIFLLAYSLILATEFNPDQKSECILFKKAEDFFNIKCTGVLHLGASIGEEFDFYKSRNVEKILYVEANPEVHARLVERISKINSSLDVRTFCFAASDKDDEELDFFLTSNLKSSSLLEMAEHKDLYPFIEHSGIIKVQAKKAESIFSENDLEKINGMVLDIQGAELNALKGCDSILEQIDFIICEVHFGELYKGSPRVESIDELLRTKNFRRIDTISNARNWGDALYINMKFLEVRHAE
ncbi:MAG: FkbM family methyltransferase [Proteobacteria bacterium]|nr:FkbM family methyltransferase [Pseudomonadota bacterium]